MAKTFLDKTGLITVVNWIKSTYQKALVSGSNIKKIGTQDVMGSGSLQVDAGGLADGAVTASKVAQDTIIIGDSYIAGEWYTGGNDWGTKLASLLGLTVDKDCWIRGANGAGFWRSGSSAQTFLTLLQGLSATIPDKAKVSRIVVCGGLNDVNASSQSDIQDAISAFMTYAKANYPNATVYVGMIGWNAGETNATLRWNVVTKVLPAYQDINTLGGVYLSGVEYILHYYTWLGTTGGSPDGSHPTVEGQAQLAKGIHQALLGGTASLTTPESSQTMTVGGLLALKITNNVLTVRLQGNSTLGLDSDATAGNKTVDLGEITATGYLRLTGTYSYFTTSAIIVYSDGSRVVQPVRLNVDSSHHLILQFYSTKSLAVTVLSWLIEVIQLPLIYN